jgi:hypothetical protein
MGEQVLDAREWVRMRGTPRHESVCCELCGITPREVWGAGWLRKGTSPQTWEHVCPTCAQAGTRVLR